MPDPATDRTDARRPALSPPAATLLAGTVLLSGCGPDFAPPNAPAHACPRISAAEYEAAIREGAVAARASVSAAGTVSMETGAGVKHCATSGLKSLRPCRRPADLVIRYALASGEVFHVRVPAGRDYRFNIQRLPNTCEILDR
jgi:hypothetical protein